MDAVETREDVEVEVFSTPTPFEAEQVALALEAAGVPLQRRLWAGGIEQVPTELFFPGGFYLIRVPASMAARAREIVQALGFNSEPAGIWPVAPPLNMRGRIQTYALICLILALIAAVGRIF
jgi:hypothetical protein